MTRLSKTIRIFAKIPDDFRNYAAKIHFFLIFFKNNLHNTKNSSIFAVEKWETFAIFPTFDNKL